MVRDEQIPKTDAAEIERVIKRPRQSNLEQKDQELVERLLRTVLTLVRVLQEKNISLKRLKRMIFGPGTDKRTGNRPWSWTEEEKTDSKEAPGSETKTPQASSSKPKRSGHGRMGSSAYRGAEAVKCRHSNLKPSDSCPDPYCGGRLYDTKEPAIFIQLRGQSLVGATRYEQEVLRCTVCLDRYTASLPVEVKSGKYDASCDVTIAVAKHGAGIPWHRLKRMQEAFGVPLPESVQFERCEAVADAILPVYLYLRKLVANGEVLYSDDTRVRILSCMKENEEREEERRGTQTTGIVIEVGGRKIALYANGRRHSGENLDELLKKRDCGLGKPIQMSDALAANWNGDEETIEASRVNEASPWKYLLALMRNKAEVRQNPAGWLPWNHDQEVINAA